MLRSCFGFGSKTLRGSARAISADVQAKIDLFDEKPKFEIKNLIFVHHDGESKL